MVKRTEYIALIDALLARNTPFAAWSVPGEKVPQFIIGGKEDVSIYPDIQSMNECKGFVFAPYNNTAESPLILLEPGIYLTEPHQVATFNPNVLPQFDETPFTASKPFVVEKGEYLEDIKATVHEIKCTKLAKAIVSRIIPASRTNESTGALYMELQHEVPNAFVYLVNLPIAGVWMGATPEILLQSKGKIFETVSLAGTQSKQTDGEYSWFTKDIEEQAFVSRYLLELFYRFKIHPYTTQGPETLESGSVAHLSTIFRFSSKHMGDNLGDFVAELHPTPAVCGLPKSKAAKFIAKIEKHQRRYYTGYLGPWQLNGAVALFVNLRCMEVFPDKYFLYSGGGITSHSIPEKEWEETNKKARTLLSVIEAIQIQ